MTQYQNPVMNIKLKITRFCNWLQSLRSNLGVEVFRCQILILMKTGFFLRIQIFNQKMQKSLDFGKESVLTYIYYKSVNIQKYNYIYQQTNRQVYKYIGI
jgi:hypothetical protein